MNVRFKMLALASAVWVPVNASALEVLGEKLEIYGKIHVSVDSSDQDDPAISNDGMSVSSNSSRIGLKGKLPTESGLDIIWQAEQEVRFDDSSEGNFANRNSFIGVAKGPHSFRAGIHDTPFKSVASKWGLFGDSVGERRSILGASFNKGNQLNERAKNMIMYQYKDKALKLQAMYGVDAEDNNSGGVDDNDADVAGLAVWYKVAGLTLSAGYEDWKQHSVIEDGSAYRLAATYKMGAHRFGAIYEDIDSDGLSVNALAFIRTAYGVNWKWKFADNTDVRVQYLVADEADNTSDTGASKIGLGLYHKLDKKGKVYLAYGSTDNDSNAKFQAVDGGHGDEVKTTNGGNPKSISVGIEYKF